MARYALVIGITQYQSSTFKNLPKAAADAESVALVLEKYGEFNVTRLPQSWNADTNRFEVSQQKSASVYEVGEALKVLLLEQGTKSDVLIYFAGHGLTFFDSLGEQKGLLATSDCQVEMVDQKVVDYKNGIALSSLNQLIQKSDVSSLVMLLDCCHSGYFLESLLVQQTLTAFSTQRDYYLIAACRGFETAKVLVWEAHAIFTGALLKGLASENAIRNGLVRLVSGDRLFDYISNELKGTQWGQEAIRMGWGRCITLVKYPQSETLATEISLDRHNPYLGLSAFEAEQEKYFCGRVEAVRILITHLTNSRFIPVIGYSGSGKSSLIKAGLLPQLSGDRIPGSSHWPVESFTPGKYPLGKLVDVLARYRDWNEPFVIFIDQFEEVFTLCEDESERGSFIRLIAEEMNNSGRKSRMIIAIRGDFLIRCTNYPDVLNLINNIPPSTYIVKSLGIEELPEAIEKPAQLHGVKFERGLVSQIAQDVAGQPGALPLLQYALKELWRVCIEKPELPEPLLTRKGYEDIGGVQGALENRANVIYQSLSEGDRLFVRKLFMELVQLGEGEGTEVTRRRVDWDRLRAIADSAEQLDLVIGLLAGAQQRLIIVDKNTVEVAHEALLCRWKLVSGWIEEDRENIRISRRLEMACREWKETYGKSDEALLTGARLAEVEEWEKRVQRNLTGDEREFLGKSVGRRDRQIQDEIKVLEREIKLTDEKYQAQKQRTKWAIVSGILLTFTLGLGLVLYGQKREQEVSKVGILIGKAQQLLESNLQLDALIASVEALNEMKKQGRENPKELQKIQSVIFNVQERNQLKAHPGGVYGVSFSPDGTMIASGGVDKKIIIWNQVGKMLFSPSEGHKETIWSVRFSPNSQFVASASIDDTIKIWSKKGELIQILKGHKGNVYDVSFSKNSDRIYSSSRDGNIIIWDVKTGRSLETFKNPNSLNKSEYDILGLDLEPLKNHVVVYTGNKDYELTLWDLKNKSNKGIKTIGKTQSLIMSARFNRNGNMIISCDNKGNIKIWDITGKLIGLINSHKDITLYAEFSYDSKYIASASLDKTIKIWNVDEVLNIWKNSQRGVAQPLTILAGHTSTVNRVSFNPLNSQSIASASSDGTVIIWEIPRKGMELDKRYKLDELLTKSCNFLSTYSNICQNLK